MDLSSYRSLAKPAILLTSPETAHGIAKWLFKRSWIWKLMRSNYCVDDPRLSVKLGRINLSNPVGLAAGFDKNCEMIEALFCMGFGYLALGTITLNPREGNPKPRLWRYPGNAIVNSMGLPNQGARSIVGTLSERRSNLGPVVVSISGLSVDEFVECYRLTEPLVDGVELNISTPNTVGVRVFQEPSVFSTLLASIAQVRTPGKRVWVKIPFYFTDKERENVLELVDECMNSSVDAITATNTKMVQEPRASIGTGGLSGPPIFEDTLRIVADLYKYTGGRIPINACGGISSGLDAWRAFESGATSIQMLTAFIYQGPGMVARINRELIGMLEKTKIKSLQELTGSVLR